MDNQKTSTVRNWLYKPWFLLAVFGVTLLAIVFLFTLSYSKVFEVSSQDNVQILARVLISEASIGNEAERKAVGLTVINRMKLSNTNKVKDVLAVDGFYHYAINQNPNFYPEYANLAKSLLQGNIVDFTYGATHFFSPYSMPKAGENRTDFDCGGGLVRYIDPITSKQEMICTPSWSKAMRYVNLKNMGIRPYYFEFYTE